MHRLYFLLLLCITFQICTAQNLILNGDFEFGPDSTSVGWCCRADELCIVEGNVDGPDDWMVVARTPDRLVEGDISCDWDDGMAQSGSAFIDFIYQEKGKTILSSPLEKDSVYQLSYYASWQTFQGTATLPSRIQFQFSEGGNVIPTPYIDDIDWQYFDTIFIATANSSELEILGIEDVIGGVNLDNISLSRYYTTNTNELQNSNQTILVFPNPFDEDLQISTSINNTLDIGLYDVWSRAILQQKFTNSVSIDTRHLAKGIYFYVIKDKSEFIQKGKVVKN